MEEPINKLLLKSNLSLQKKNTLYSTNENINSFTAKANNAMKNKQFFAFKSISKQYISPIVKNSQIESVNDKKRMAKTPNNFLFKRSDKKQNIKRAKTLQLLKKCDSRITNESLERSDFFIGQKIDMDLININISILASYFKSIYPDQSRVKKFNEEFKNQNIEGYEEILLLMKEFRDFNIFDYLSVSSVNSFFLTKEKQEERNKNICKRNNIILSLLIEHDYLREKEEKGIIVYRKNMKMFNSSQFLFPLLENFKTILMHLSDNENAFEVELLIFGLLDYYEYALFVYQCHVKYFNDFLNKIGLGDYDFNKFLKIIDTQDFENLGKEEILIFRKIINSMAERDFFLGLDKIITNDKLCKLTTEGRLWKNIGNTMEAYDIFKLWCEYKAQIDIGNVYILNRNTINIEYNQEIKSIKEQIKKYDKSPSLKKENYEKYKKLLFRLDCIQKEIELPFISDIEDLFLIFFKYNLKNIVMYFLDNLKVLNIKIFEMCLAFDEDISINILDRCLKNSNVKPSYIHLCIYKKYFRLTRMLLKFQSCKNELIKFYDKNDFHGHIGKKKYSVYYQYQEGKEDVLHFLNEKEQVNFDNSIISNKNTFAAKNTHSPEGIKFSKTIIKPIDYMNRIFRKIFPKKNRYKKRNSICTPNIHTIKKSKEMFGPTIKIKNPKCKSYFGDEKKQIQDIDNISNVSSSHLQSSTNTLIIKDKIKKNSFFSVLNIDIKKENFFSTNNVNTPHTPNSNYYVDNIIIEENPESPQEKQRQESGNRVSKFSVMKINGLNLMNSSKDNDKTEEDAKHINDSDLEKEIQKKNQYEICDKKNKSLRPRNRVRNLSIEYKIVERKRKSYKEDSDEIIKKLKNKIRKKVLKNGNNISVIEDYDENGSRNDDSPILKIIYNTDGEDCDSNRLVIKNKSLFGMLKTGRKSQSMNQFEKKESSSKEKESVINKRPEKNQNMDKNEIKDKFIHNRFPQININNTFHPKKTNMLLAQERKEKLEYQRKSQKNLFSIFDPTSQKILNGKIRINIQYILIENLRFGQFLFDAICLLGFMPLREFTVEMCEKICLNLNSYNTNEESIINCPYPLLSIALSAELLNKLGNISIKIKYNADSVLKSLLFLGYNIQTTIANEDTLNFYLRMQTDISGRSALEIYAENKFYNMLEDPNVGLIIGKLWYGAEHEHKITTFLRMTRILRANTDEFYDYLIKKDYLPDNSRFSFQFCQYIQNCSERNFYESISTMIITLLYQVVVYLYVTFTKEDINHPKTHSYYYIQVLTDILMLLHLINDILCQIFFRLTGRRVKIEKMQVFIDFILFVFLLINFLDIPQLLYPSEKDPDFNILLDGIVYSILLLMSWLKVLLLLRITKIYGSFISIMLNIFWHVFNFFIVFICITLLFAQCFCLYFKESNDNYKLIYDSFLTLFNTAWGQVEFTFIELDIFGEISLGAFATVSNIMLFNLIVGIVDNLFDKYHQKSEAQSRAKLVLAHERKKWDDSYGLLILFPSPFNIFTIIFLPFLVFSGDDKQKLNLLFSKLCYFFIALIQFLYIILLGISTFILALIKSLFLSTYETMTSTNKEIQHHKYKIILLLFIKRPFELIIYFIEDCILFWKLVFIEPAIDDEKKKQELTTFRRYIITLRKLFNDYKYKEHQTKLPVRDISKKFSLFKKRSTFHFTRVETSSQQNTEVVEEDKEWQKMINHTLFLQLNGQKKRKGQDYSESISLTDGLSDTKSFQISYYKHNKKTSKKESMRKRSDIGNNSAIRQGTRISQPKQMVININRNDSENEDYHIGNLSKDNSTMILQKKITTIEAAKMQMSFHLIKSLWKFIDKFVDPEGVIDIDRALNLLPDKATYDTDFIQNMEYFNIRTLIRAIRKYYFSLEEDSPLYSFNKGYLMIYKLMMKLKMVYHYIPEKSLKKIKPEFENLNDMNKFSKTAEVFQKYEERDIMSDYDDEGKYAENNRIDTISMLDTSKVGVESDSEHSPPNKSFVSIDKNMSNAE